ncbi:MAG: virulence protein RhuM/Fic/DOC family protein [Parcubacteria group bacterium]|jgi:prophage maintenance system killer protein/prophage antirepressor-like protein
MEKEVIIYQGKSGAIELKGDFKRETIWANLQQIADLFEADKSGISRHIKNIFSNGELAKKSTVAKIATVRKEGNREIKREIEFYNLDMILSVGYRVNSKKATEFRKWATKTLRQHILEGYTLNKKQLAKNYEAFLKAVEDVKKLLPSGGKVRAEDALELMKIFASTWLSLDAYDKETLPKIGATKKQVRITADNISEILLKFREELISQKEASELFGTERTKGDAAGIVGNVFQAFGGKDLYPTLEEKAAHLLYFMVKDHPFVDGNKRSGAFAFVWFLRKAKILDTRRLTPEALTALTLLVAESRPKDKERMVGLILILLK